MFWQVYSVLPHNSQFISLSQEYHFTNVAQRYTWILRMYFLPQLPEIWYNRIISHILPLFLSPILLSTTSNKYSRRWVNDLNYRSAKWNCSSSRPCVHERMRACVRACAFTINGAYASRISLYTHMFLHIVYHKDFCYAQRTTSSPRGTIINARPAACTLAPDDDSQTAKIISKSFGCGPVAVCTSVVRTDIYRN